MLYNVRVKTYPDGTRQYMYSEKAKLRDYEIEERKSTGEHVERKEKENNKRAVQKVFDLARSNRFDWFITLTFDPKKVDRYSYDDCADAMKRFTKMLCKADNTWLIVPEQHEDGAFHFHGLIGGHLNLSHFKDDIYNLDDYDFGFTTAMPIKDPKRVATYIAKYLTKEISVPKGRKRYWASRSLNKPTEEFIEMFSDEFGELFNNARYQKLIESPYGSFLLCED